MITPDWIIGICVMCIVYFFVYNELSKDSEESDAIEEEEDNDGDDMSIEDSRIDVSPDGGEELPKASPKDIYKYIRSYIPKIKHWFHR